MYAPLSNKIGKIEVTKNLFIFDEGKKLISTKKVIHLNLPKNREFQL